MSEAESTQPTTSLSVKPKWMDDDYRKKKAAYDRDHRKKNAAILAEKRKEKYAKNAPAIRAYNAKWRSEHAEQYRACLRKSYRKNSARYIKKAIEWARKNRKKVTIYSRNWRHRNKKAFNEIRRKKYAKDPAKYLSWNHVWRANAAKVPVRDRKIIEKWHSDWRKKKRVSCFWCMREMAPKKCHADHILPFEKGGSHAIENLCISCAKCNTTKGKKTPSDWNSLIENPMLL